MSKNDEGAGPGADEEARFIAAVKRIREQRGWSQGELARRMAASGWEGFHQTTISRIEKGERPVRLGEARGLAAVLETRLNEMIMPLLDAEDLDELNRAIEYAMTCRRGIGESVKAYDMIQGTLRLLIMRVEGRNGTGEASPELLELVEIAKDICAISPKAIFDGALEEIRAEAGFLSKEIPNGEHSEEA